MITRLENPADAAELFETFHDTMECQSIIEPRL